MMDGKGFFLGLIAAVVLFLLWKKESGTGMNFSFAGLVPQGAGPGAGFGGPECSTCGGSPSYASAPALQSMLANGTSGQITPGTPPLQSVAGVGSFYAVSGSTPDNSFTNIPRPRPVSTAVFAAPQASAAPNVPSSPSTPATNVPVRAVSVVPPYRQQGFSQRYNIVGIQRNNLRYIQ